MRKFFLFIAFIFLCSLMFGQASGIYQASIDAKPSSQDLSDLKKIMWTVNINNKPITIDSLGNVLNGSISFHNKVRDTDSITGIEYVCYKTLTILSIGYENDDSAYAVFYTVDSGFTETPVFLMYSTGFGSNQFLSDGEKVFEATQFSYHFFNIKLKKDIWNNNKSIGDDCHYDNQVQYQGNNIVKIIYTHYVQNMKRFASASISLKDGNEVKK